MPEFLLNSNNFNLGVKQTGAPLTDVQLPPWAATPQDFVRINREALESEYVLGEEKRRKYSRRR